MSVNSGNNSAWEGDDNNTNKGEQETVLPGTAGLMKSGLAGLFALPSMTSDSRNLKEVVETTEQITELYKRAKNSTTAPLQLRVIPEVENMTPSISPVLPGICFYREIGGVMYVMGALFSNKGLTNASEYIRFNNVGMAGGQQAISAPITPANYADKTVLDNMRAHYTKHAETNNAPGGVTVINMIVVDLEMLNHPEAPEPKDRPHALAQYLVSAWEEAILVKIPQEMAIGNQDLPNPFINKTSPYGKDGCAEARVSAISGRMTVAKTLSPANMEVVVSTMNANNNQGQFGANSKEIARVTATVSLNAQAFSVYQQQLTSGRMQQDAMQRMMNLGGGIYPQGYRPLAPAITIEEAMAGEMMDYNQGLYPYFFGLYSLMATNNNFVFVEALRKHSVGARGNLAGLEVRIDEMLAMLGGNVPGRIILNDKNVSDTDLVNQWIRQNVSPHATFQVNINPCGPHSSIQNFLVRLSHPVKRKDEVKTVIGVMDALSNKAFSAIVARNVESKTGWNPTMPILHRTPTISVNGLAGMGGKKFNTQELDEMMLGSMKGKGGLASIQNYLGIQYGMTNEDFKARCQKLRIELNQSLFDGDVHINSFTQTHIWDPLFMSAIGEAMEGIGAMNVANNMGSFRSNNLVYATGGGLATYASVGSNNLNGGVVGGNNLQYSFG